MAPELGWMRPAISLSRLDLPQPDGPTITENSLFATSSEMLSSAVTGLPVCGVKRRVTASMRSLALPEPSRTSEVLGPGQEPVASCLEQLVGQESEETYDHDAEEDLVGIKAAHR